MKQVKQNTKNTKAKEEETPKAVVPTVAPTVQQGTYVDDSEYSLRTAELNFNTEVYDEGDIASALEISYIVHALEMHKAKVAPETHPDFDGESCVDCGEGIHEVRLQLGKVRCVYCQEILEKKNKLRG